ncbi:MAG TPA: DNA alkylation repair protein [Rhizobiales bacterium]|nr:DNA alkylation repair protein [Hyphomicrobiales bacterium]
MMDPVQEYLDAVEERLAGLAVGINPHKAEERARFMKVTMPLLGLPVPVQRRAAKKPYSFTRLPLEAQLPVWEHIWWNARTHEGKCQPLYYLMQLSERSPDLLWPVLRGWGRGVNCWDQSDYLSKIYNEFLSCEREALLRVFKSWVHDDYPWQRRIGLVSLFGFGGRREWYPPVQDVLSMVEDLLADGDYYVQKGLGWCLRECFLVYPQESLWFLSENAARLAPAAWPAATEKLSAEQKSALRKLRRKGR